MNPEVLMLNPPALDIDKILHPDGKIHVDGMIERRIVFALIERMRERGWHAFRVWDGECLEQTTDTKSAMEIVFNLDEASVRFTRYEGTKRVGTWHGVLLVLGNGEDIVSDWNYTDGDPDGFNAAVQEVCDYIQG